MLSDLKEGLSSARKPDVTHVRRVLLSYVARACEYGNARYARANYLRPVAGPYDGTPKPADFRRLRSYLRAALSHVACALDALELHESLDPGLEDVEGMRRAALAADTDEPPAGSKVGASHLPHLAHAAASLMMALVQAALSGLLPEDPGQTWEVRGEEPRGEEPQPVPKSPQPFVDRRRGLRCPHMIGNRQCSLVAFHSPEQNCVFE